MTVSVLNISVCVLSCVQFSETPWTAASRLFSPWNSQKTITVPGTDWCKIIHFCKRLYFELKGQKQRSVVKRTLVQFESVSVSDLCDVIFLKMKLIEASLNIRNLGFQVQNKVTFSERG